MFVTLEHKTLLSRTTIFVAVANTDCWVKIIHFYFMY